MTAITPPQQVPQAPRTTARSYWLTAPNAADTAKLARDHVARLLRHNGHAELADTARLLTSEIVTNAFAHTTVPFVTIETTIDPDRILIAVYDASSQLPEPRTAVADDETGRGLLLVQLLASDWGVNGGPRGKRTWFELRSGC
jgi:anti-sigma regulatory factor (Ser/Thr protein kinase)